MAIVKTIHIISGKQVFIHTDYFHVLHHFASLRLYTDYRHFINIKILRQLFVFV